MIKPLFRHDLHPLVPAFRRAGGSVQRSGLDKGPKDEAFEPGRWGGDARSLALALRLDRKR